jgi:hypothetical protein
MPDVGMVNHFPRLILLSPLHRLLSRHFLVLAFRGRKTGRRYELPVAYVRREGGVIMTTDSRWWRNLQGGAPVELTIAGRRLSGTGWAVTEAREVEAALRDLIAMQPSYARLAGVQRLADGSMDFANAAKKRVLIRASLEPTQ